MTLQSDREKAREEEYGTVAHFGYGCCLAGLPTQLKQQSMLIQSNMERGAVVFIPLHP